MSLTPIFRKRSSRKIHDGNQPRASKFCLRQPSLKNSHNLSVIRLENHHRLFIPHGLGHPLVLVSG